MTSAEAQRAVRQFVVGLLAVPLSALPLLAYLTFTPEGRLVRDRIEATVRPPSIPALTARQQWIAAVSVPAYQDRVLTLVYHGIGSGADGDGTGGGRFAISPRRFGEHLAMLKAAGMHAVTASEVAAAFSGGPPLPPKAVMITFDDGRSDAMLFADPLLKKSGMRATMFVITGATSRPGVYYAGWDRLESAARSGRWDLEAHTDAEHHEQKVADGSQLPALTSLAPGETLDAYRQRVRRDLARCSDAIAAHTGRRPVAFAYPFGAYGSERTNDPAIRGILREEVARQYSLAFHQDIQDSIPLVDAGQDRLGLRRLEVGNWTGIDLLARVKDAVARSGVAPVAVDAAASPAPAAVGSTPASSGSAAAVPGIVRVVLPPVTVTVPVTVPVPVVATVPTTTVAPLPTPLPTVSTSTTSTTTPTTVPPPTSPSTTSPPTTSPPTTTVSPVCKGAGRKCTTG